MQYENHCRTCLQLVKKQPFALTDDIFEFLAQDLGMLRVPKQHPILRLPLILCFNCHRLLLKFNQFLVKCREVETFFKSKIESLQQNGKDMEETQTELEEFDEPLYEKPIDWILCEEATSNLDEKEVLEDFDDSNEADVVSSIFSPDEVSVLEKIFVADSKPKRAKRKIYGCSHCDMRFTVLSHQRDHENIHKGIRPYCCDICGKCFTQNSTLITHQRTHFGKSVNCDECGKKFARKSELILHNRMHRDEKPFVCDFENCNAKFRRRSQLSNHKVRHTGVRSFRCDLCGNSFFNKRCLGTHIYKVHPKFSYQCDVCFLWFSNPGCIRNHMSSKHNVKIDDVEPLRNIRSTRKRKNFCPLTLADETESV